MQREDIRVDTGRRRNNKEAQDLSKRTSSANTLCSKNSGAVRTALAQRCTSSNEASRI
jgi:hypothetical protein